MASARAQNSAAVSMRDNLIAHRLAARGDLPPHDWWTLGTRPLFGYAHDVEIPRGLFARSFSISLHEAEPLLKLALVVLETSYFTAQSPEFLAQGLDVVDVGGL